MRDFNALLDQLKAGEIPSLEIAKEEFMDFRKLLVDREDFKHFKGTAHHYGKTVYTFTIEPSK